jgi:hypothetical protein
MSSGEERNSRSVRQPVSCEPCRKRKIRCSRTRPPCDTCRKRRCPESCTYAAYREIAAPQDIPFDMNVELLNRITNLENHLRQHTYSAVVNNGCSGPMLSPPIEELESTSSDLSPNSFLNVSNISPSPASSTLQRVGSLTTSSSGNVRYETRASQWTAVLANTHIALAAPSLDEDFDDSEDSKSGFPFTSLSVPTLEELLTLLPPIQQCDYLKNVYFNVFSPVCLQLPGWWVVMLKIPAFPHSS